MSYGATMLVLFAAALMEVGGDAIVRTGMHSASSARRFAMILAGTLFLAAYGFTVNSPSWDFGRLLGVYVAIVFVVAQFVAWIAFDRKPAPALLLGGALIVIGGCIVSFGE